MCRACSENGGRRCPRTDAVRARERAAAARYYQRKKARVVIARLRAAGVPAMDDRQCPPTYHLGRDLPGDLAARWGARGAAAYKPVGLWAAPGTSGADGVRTGWTDFLERGGVPATDDDRLFRIEAQPGAVVVRLEGEEDVRAFASCYPGFTIDDNPLTGSREGWREVLDDDVSAVFLTDSGVVAAKRMYYGGGDRDDRGRRMAGILESWDAASVCWMRPDHLAVTGEVPAAASADGGGYDEGPVRTALLEGPCEAAA